MTKFPDFLYDDESSDTNMPSDNLSSDDLSKDQFNMLWALNPNHNDANDNFNSTYNMLRDVLAFGKITSDGQLTTFDLVYKRYKKYLRIKRMINDGIDPKFIKKENKVMNLFEYIYNDMYFTDVETPLNSRHYYFWGDHNDDYLLNQYKNFMSICEKNP